MANNLADLPEVIKEGIQLHSSSSGTFPGLGRLMHWNELHHVCTVIRTVYSPGDQQMLPLFTYDKSSHYFCMPLKSLSLHSLHNAVHCGSFQKQWRRLCHQCSVLVHGIKT